MSGVDPNWGWQAICFLVGIIGAASGLASIFTSRRTQKREVTLMDGGATQADVQKVDKDLNAKIEGVKQNVAALSARIDATATSLSSKLDTGIQLLSKELKEAETRISDRGEERSVELHRRFNETQEKVGELRGEMKMVTSERRKGI